MSEQQQQQKKKEKKPKKKSMKHLLKNCKGTRDYGPDETGVREATIAQIKGVFRQHGGQAIETPVFELRELLLGKYGDDEKLVYDLEDQGGEIASLRYDLTVPFSRWMAQNSVQRIKRYQVGRVYRRDQPNFKSGRFREFYQCDFDIAGDYSPMVPDAECVTIMAQILSSVDVGPFQIKLNNRKLLDLVFATCQVPEALFATACSSVDKLDKLPWDKVREELVGDKGIAPEAADALREYVEIKGEPRAVLEQLRAKFPEESKLMDSFGLLFDYLEAFGALQFVEFDLSLARGLGYYTGIIFEAKLTDPKLRSIGSVGGGGRYDNLIGSLGNRQIPCVGMSVGIERLFAVLLKKNKGVPVRTAEVFVASIERELLLPRMHLVKELWDAGLNAEILLKATPKIQAQLKYAADNNISLAVIIGSQELENNTVQVKDLRVENFEQIEVARDQLAKTLKDML